MTPQEAQQAQTIKECRFNHENCVANHGTGQAIFPPFSQIAHRDREALLEIVDSQAYKITSLEAMAEINRSALETAKSLIESKTAEIAEARKLAEKMRDASERPGGGHTFLPWERKP